MAEVFHPRILLQGAFTVAPNGDVYSPKYIPIDWPESFIYLNSWELNNADLKKSIEYTRKHFLSEIKIDKYFLDLESKIVSWKKDAKYDENAIKSIADYFGLDVTNKTTFQTILDYTKLEDKEQKKVIIRCLLNNRLDMIERNPRAFIQTVSAKKEQYLKPEFSQKIVAAADATTRLSYPTLRIGMGAPIAYSSYFFFDPNLATTITQLYTAGLVSMVATVALAPTIAKYTHALAKNSREWSPYEQKKILDNFHNDLGHMPEKTKRLLAESDPMLFILDSQMNFPGWLATPRFSEELPSPVMEKPYVALFDWAQNAAFVAKNRVGGKKWRAIFEEISHGNHEFVIGKTDPELQMLSRFEEAFLKDIKKITAKGFVLKNSVKKIFWEGLMYPRGGAMGAEILVECEHMMCTLTERNRMSEKDALKRIQYYLPRTGVLYAQYLDMEEKFLNEIEQQKKLSLELTENESIENSLYAKRLEAERIENTPPQERNKT